MPRYLPAFAAIAADAMRRHWRGRERYTVLQTGFGDGVQLLRTWDALLEDAQAPRKLHYLIIEPRPCSFSSVHADARLAAQLRQAWPPLVSGYHRLFLEQGRLMVTLIFGGTAACLPQLDAVVDWFSLQDEVMQNPAAATWLGRIAAPRAQLVAAGDAPVSWPPLEQAGFILEDEFSPAYFAPRWRQAPAESASASPARHAIVIGAGLAGSAACESLAMRGWQVTLIEQHAEPAQEASGNLAGIYMPAISRDDNPTARLTRAAFLFAQQVWRRIGVFEAFGSDENSGAACGVLQLARDAEQATAFATAAQHWRYPADYAQYLSAQEAGARLGTATGSGWFFPSGGWLRPGAVCEAMLQACGERLQQRFHTAAVSLQRSGEEWRVWGGDGQIIAQAPVLILASGMQALQFPEAASLPLHAIRGQVSHVPASLLPALPFVLCGDGYVAGAVDGLVSVGASYDQDDGRALRATSHTGNLDKLRQMLPQWRADIDPAALSGRVGFRCVSADRLPLIGGLPDMERLAAGGEVQLKDLPRQPQLYGLLGYASRGLIWAPLAAEILACRLDGEPAPLGKDLLALLDPARFALKAHRHPGQ